MNLQWRGLSRPGYCARWKRWARITSYAVRPACQFGRKNVRDDVITGCSVDGHESVTHHAAVICDAPDIRCAQRFHQQSSAQASASLDQPARSLALASCPPSVRPRLRVPRMGDLHENRPKFGHATSGEGASQKRITPPESANQKFKATGLNEHRSGSG